MFHKRKRFYAKNPYNNIRSFFQFKIFKLFSENL